MSLLRKFIFVLALYPALSWANPIDINIADAALLATVSGLGPSKAQAIVDYRNSHGPFSSVEALSEVKGIGAKTLDKLRESVTVKGQ